MAQVVISIADFNQASYFQSYSGRDGDGTVYQGYTTPSYSNINKTISNSIPAGSTINSAIITFTRDTGLYGVYTQTPASGSSITVTPGNDTTIAFQWRTKTGGSYPTIPSKNNINYLDKTGLLKLTGITVTIDYTLPYTSVTAPTSVTGGTTSAVPGGTYRISWSGASDGTNNPVASYTLRRDDGTEWTTTNAYYDVSASTTNGGSYSYTVRSNATVAGYSSGFSSASTTLTTSFS